MRGCNEWVWHKGCQPRLVAERRGRVLQRYGGVPQVGSFHGTVERVARFGQVPREFIQIKLPSWLTYVARNSAIHDLLVLESC